MGTTDLLYRRSASGVVLGLSLMIGFAAVDPYSETPVIGRIAMLVVVALLIVGVLPGSYLQMRIHAASRKESVLRSKLLRVMGLMAPMVLVALASFSVYDDYSMLRLIDNTSFDLIDRGEVKFNVVRWWTIGLASVVWLVLAAATLLRKGARHQQTPL